MPFIARCQFCKRFMWKQDAVWKKNTTLGKWTYSHLPCWIEKGYIHQHVHQLVYPEPKQIENK